jgi:F-box protein 11
MVKASGKAKKLPADLRRPAGFLSYSHFDDQNDHGWISEFRLKLSREVQAQTGSSFHIFWDRKDIKWGQNWKKRIEESIATATFFFPIVTPSFLLSPECKKELTLFLKHQTALGRDDLLMPVHYIDCPPFKRARKTAPVKALLRPQMADWRKLRFEKLDDREPRMALADLAVQVRDAMSSN